MKFIFNLRTLNAPLSGVQRYARELDTRFGKNVIRVTLAKQAQGIIGHCWEQFILPLRCRDQLLFSPGNTGPLLHRQQVVTIHDAATFDQRDAFTGLFGHWYRWLLPRLARRSLGVITVSHFSRVRLAAALDIPVGKIAVVYNGITQPPVSPGATALAATRSKFNLPKRFLLFVGSHDPRKNVARLLAAFGAADLGDLHLVLAGGSNRQLFNAALPAVFAGRVQRLGQVTDPDLEALYALAEGFIFPSLYEGFGLPPLEAMARGCPVLCSDASCLPEVCGPAFELGGACLYFSPHDTASITHALTTFASLPTKSRERMITAGRKQSNRYSWDRCAQETTEALRHFAAQSVSVAITASADRSL